MSLHPRANNSVREAKGKEIHSSMVSVIKGKNSVMGENIKENMILNGGVGDRSCKWGGGHVGMLCFLVNFSVNLKLL